MTRKAGLPPELGGKTTQEKWAEQAGREIRKEFVRDIETAIKYTPTPTKPDVAHGLYPAEKAAILRTMADNLEKSGGPVDRAQQRLKERNDPRAVISSRRADKFKQPVIDHSGAEPMKHFARKRDEQERDR